MIYSAEDPAPSPEETSLEHDRHRRIADALSHIPEMDRKLLALVYYENHSIVGAGRLLGWGKSRADRHHAAALERLRVLVGPRDLLSPALVGLVAQATALADRGRLIGGAVNRYSARAQDLADALARTTGSLRRSTEEAARRAAPFADAGTPPIPGGAGRVIAQCGALAAAAICSAVLLSPVERGLEAVLPIGPSKSPGSSEPRGPNVQPEAPEPTSSGSPQITAPEVGERPRSAARAAGRSRRQRRRAARRAKLARARRARQLKAKKAKASAAKRNSPIEAPEENTPETAPEEVAPEAEAVAPEVAPAPETAPPPATGGQTREQFGL